MSMKFDSVRIMSTGITLSVGTTSANCTLPSFLADGTISILGASSSPRYVRVVPEAACYIHFGTTASVSASLNDILVTPNQDLAFNVAGVHFVAAITRSGGTQLNIVPIET